MSSAREVLLQQVIDLAQVCGWRCYHPRPARTLRGWKTALQGSPGYVDLTLCRPPRLIMAEIKRPGDAPTMDQRLWLEQLAQVPGVEVFLWFPKDWDSIIQVLR
jgi:hypothetical protein